ncbi:hypothetical protein D1007_59034 [Hordeum vulgare]|nr:hypothetical protein D1007_59034 [Hordeum vulgare]
MGTPRELLAFRNHASSSSGACASSRSPSSVSVGHFIPSVLADSDRPDVIEVFMLKGEYAVAPRLAFVAIEPPDAFINCTLAVQDAVFYIIGYHMPEVVPSLVGAMYLLFASWEDRREALSLQLFMHEGAHNNLFPEETFNFIAPRLDMCVVLPATGFPTEFITPKCISVIFSGFGKVLEIDPLVLSGRELATMRAMVLLANPWGIPCDVWLLGG